MQTDPIKFLQDLAKKEGRPISDDQVKSITEKYNGRWSDFLDDYSQKIGKPISPEQKESLISKYNLGGSVQDAVADEVPTEQPSKKKEDTEAGLESSLGSSQKEGSSFLGVPQAEQKGPVLNQIQTLKASTEKRTPKTDKTFESSDEAVPLHEALKSELERNVKSMEVPSPETSYGLGKVSEDVKKTHSKLVATKDVIESKAKDIEKLAGPWLGDFQENLDKLNALSPEIEPIINELNRISELHAKAIEEGKTNEANAYASSYDELIAQVDKETMEAYNEAAREVDKVQKSKEFAQFRSLSQDYARSAMDFEKQALQFDLEAKNLDRLIDLFNAANQTAEQKKLSQEAAFRESFTQAALEVNNKRYGTMYERVNAPEAKSPLLTDDQARYRHFLKKMDTDTSKASVAMLIKAGYDNDEIKDILGMQEGVDLPMSLTERAFYGIPDAPKLEPISLGGVEFPATTSFLSSIINASRGVAAAPFNIASGALQPLALIEESVVSAILGSDVTGQSDYRKYISKIDQAANYINGTPLPVLGYKDFSSDKNIIQNTAIGAAIAGDAVLMFVPTLATGMFLGPGAFIPQVMGMESAAQQQTLLDLYNDGKISRSELYKQASENNDLLNNIVVGAGMGALEQISFARLTGAASILRRNKPLQDKIKFYFRNGTEQGLINWLEAGLSEFNREAAVVRTKYADQNLSPFEYRLIAMEKAGSFLVSHEGIDAAIKAAIGGVIISGYNTASSRIYKTEFDLNGKEYEMDKNHYVQIHKMGLIELMEQRSKLDDIVAPGEKKMYQELIDSRISALKADIAQESTPETEADTKRLEELSEELSYPKLNVVNGDRYVQESKDGLSVSEQEFSKKSEAEEKVKQLNEKFPNREFEVVDSYDKTDADAEASYRIGYRDTVEVQAQEGEGVVGEQQSQEAVADELAPTVEWKIDEKPNYMPDEAKGTFIEPLMKQEVKMIDPVTGEERKGNIFFDGQEVVFTDGKKEISLGSLQDALESGQLNVEAIEPSFTINESGEIDFVGNDTIPAGKIKPQGKGLKAIKRDKKGNVKRVVVTGSDGNTYNLKGELANEIADLMLYNLAQQGGLNRKLKEDEKARKEFIEAVDAEVSESTESETDERSTEGVQERDERGVVGEDVKPTLKPDAQEEEVESEKTKKDESDKEVVLEDTQEGGDKDKGGQEGEQLRSKEEVKQPIAQEIDPETGVGLATLPVASIKVDPKRFQFKADTDSSTGASDRLKGKKFTQAQAGVISVWRDPADGEVYVVNGHHRLDLAVKSGVEKINVQFIEAENANEARLSGALVNIAEGSGSDVDAAKVIREKGLTLEDLKDYGLSLSDSKASNGLALAKLSDGLFNLVATGKLSPNIGIIIGNNISSHAIQEQFYNLIKGKNYTNQTIEVMAQDMEAAPKETKQSDQMNLFGETEQEVADYATQANFIAGVRAALSKAKNLLGKASRNKEFLEQYGNKIDQARADGISEEAAQALSVFDTLRRSSPFAEIIQEGVERIKNGESKNKVINETVEKVIEATNGIVGGKSKAPSPRKSPDSKRKKAQPTTTKEQLKEFGVADEMLEPVESVISKVFGSLKKAGITAAKTTRDWLNIGKASKADDRALRQITLNGEQVSVRPLENQVDVVNGFYSPIEKALAGMQQKRGTASQFLSQLKKAKGVKADELQFTGVEEWLASQGNNKITKQDILDYMKENRIEIVEVVRLHSEGKAEYFKRQVDQEGDNYKEVLVTLPSRKSFQQHEVKNINGQWVVENQKTGVQLKFGDEELARNQAKRLNSEKSIDFEKQFKSTHFEEPNILVHLRMSTRYLSQENTEYLDPKTHIPDFDSDFEVRDNGDSYSVRKKGESWLVSTYPKKFMSDNNISLSDLKAYLMKYNILGKMHSDFKNNKKSISTQVLFLEEIQSDWGQEGKKEGFSPTFKLKKEGDVYNVYSSVNNMESPAFAFDNKEDADKMLSTLITANSPKPPTAPFVTQTPSWVKLGLKTAIKEAIAQGATKIAWTTGAQQNERYDLSKQVDKITYRKLENGDYRIVVYKDGNALQRQDLKENELESNFGKDVAERIVNDNGEVDKLSGVKSLSGVNLSVGGSGMKAFYDNIVPKQAKAVIKELTGKEGKLSETVITIGDSAIEKESDGTYFFIDAETGESHTGFKTEKEAKEFAKENDITLNETQSTQQSIDITPELAAAVGEGMPLFQQDNIAQREMASIKSKSQADGTFMKAPNGKPTNLTEQQWLQVRTSAFKNWFGDWINDPENSSKVVDKNGEPLVVYHGSAYGGITSFNRSSSKRVSSGIREMGTYFTTNKKLAEFYQKNGKLDKDFVAEIDKKINDLRNAQLKTRSNKDFYEIESEINRLEALKSGKVYPSFLNLREVKSFNASGQENIEAWNNLSVRASYKTATNRDAMEFLKDGLFGVDKVDGIHAKNIVDAFVQGNEQLRDELIGDVYLVFDGQENNIKSATENTGAFSPDTDNTLYQQANAQYRTESGKNIIEALKDFDGSPKAVTAIIHEIMHPTVVEILNGANEGNEVALRHANTIVDEYNKANPSSPVTLAEMIEANDAFKNGTTTENYRNVQEFIAEAWEQYHLEGKQGFSQAFQKMLDTITDAFRAVYGSLTGKELTPELRTMFNEILGADAKQTTETTTEKGTDVESPEKAGREKVTIDEIQRNYKKLYELLKKSNQKEFSTSEIKNLLVSLYSKVHKFRTGALKNLELIKETESLLETLPDVAKYMSKAEVIKEIESSNRYSKEQKEVLKALVNSLTTDKLFSLNNLDSTSINQDYYFFVKNIIKARSPEAFAHEVGHWAFHSALSAKDRVEYMEYVIDRFYGTNKSMSDDLAYVGGKMKNQSKTKGLTSNVADDFNEYFAEQFRQYVFSSKSDNQIKTFFESLKDFLDSILSVFREVGYNKDLVTYFDKAVDYKSLKDSLEKLDTETKGKIEELTKAQEKRTQMPSSQTNPDLKMVNRFVNAISKAFPNIETVTSQDVFDKVRDSLKLNKDVAGFFHDGVIYISPSLADGSSAIEEYAHLWVAILETANPQVYKRAVGLAKKDGIYSEVENDPMYADRNARDIEHEALAKAITSAVLAQSDVSTRRRKLSEDIWLFVRKALYKLSGGKIRIPATPYKNVYRMNFNDFMRIAHNELMDGIPLTKDSSVDVAKVLKDGGFSGKVNMIGISDVRPSKLKTVFDIGQRMFMSSGLMGREGQRIKENYVSKSSGSRAKVELLHRRLMLNAFPAYVKANNLNDKQQANMVNDFQAVFNGEKDYTELPTELQNPMAALLIARNKASNDILAILGKEGKIIMNENLNLMFVENLQGENKFEGLIADVFEYRAKLEEKILTAKESELESIAQELEMLDNNLRIYRLYQSAKKAKALADLTNEIKNDSEATAAKIYAKMANLLAKAENQQAQYSQAGTAMDANQENTALEDARNVLAEANKLLKETQAAETNTDDPLVQQRLQELAEVRQVLEDIAQEKEKGLTKAGLLKALDKVTRMKADSYRDALAEYETMAVKYKANADGTYDLTFYQKSGKKVEAKGLTQQDIKNTLPQKGLRTVLSGAEVGYYELRSGQMLQGNRLATSIRANLGSYTSRFYLAHHSANYRDYMEKLLGPERLARVRKYISDRYTSRRIKGIRKEQLKDGTYQYVFVNEFGLESKPYVAKNITKTLMDLGLTYEEVNAIKSMDSAETIDFGKITGLDKNIPGEGVYIEFKMTDDFYNRILDEILPNQRDQGSDNIVSRKVDISPLKRKKNVPEDVRLILGEVTQFDAVVIETLRRQDALIDTYNYARNIMDAFPEAVSYNKKPNAKWIELGPAQLPFLANREDTVYMEPNLYNELFGGENDMGGIEAFFTTLSGYAKFALTAANPGTNARNYIGGYKLLTRSGNTEAIQFMPFAQAVVIGGGTDVNGFYRALNVPMLTSTKLLVRGLNKMVPLIKNKQLADLVMELANENEAGLMHKADKVKKMQDLVDSTKALENLKVYFTEKGFFAGSPGVAHLEEALAMMNNGMLSPWGQTMGAETKGAKVKKYTLKQMEAIGKVYQEGDAVFKIALFLQEYKRLSARYKRNGVANADELADQVATERVRNNYPNYGRSPRFFRLLSKSPAVGNFILFRTELVRNTYNTYKDAFTEIVDADNKTKLEGLNKFSQLTVAIPGYWGYASLASYLVYRGYVPDEEEEDAIKLGLPSYSKYNNLLVKEIDGMQMKYWDYTFEDVDSEIVSMIRLIRKKRYSDAGKVVHKGMFSPDISSSAILMYLGYLNDDDAKSLKNDIGMDIFTVNDSDSMKFAKSVFNLGKVFTPKAITEIGKLADGAKQAIEDLTTDDPEALQQKRLDQNEYKKDFLGDLTNNIMGRKSKTRDMSGAYKNRFRQVNEKLYNAKRQINAGSTPSQLEIYFQNIDEAIGDAATLLEALTYLHLEDKNPANFNEKDREQAKKKAGKWITDNVDAFPKAMSNYIYFGITDELSRVYLVPEQKAKAMYRSNRPLWIKYNELMIDRGLLSEQQINKFHEIKNK